MIRMCRNDDVASDTTLSEIRTFCEICDRYGVTPMHAITPIGKVRSVDCKWDNATIREQTGTALFSENREVVEYLRERRTDLFAVHGLWHTHAPKLREIDAADTLIVQAGLTPTFFVPPFNEGYDTAVDVAIRPGTPGMRRYLHVSGRGVPRLEEYLESGDPQAEIVYLHSHRFEYGPFTWKQLDSCLKRLTAQ